ncbi:MAG: alpha/beta fold hydrolase [Phycisphaerales bacterium]
MTTPVVLLHGLLLGPEMWDPLVESLAPRLVATPRLVADTFDGLLDSALRALDAVAPDAPAVLGGLSMGGIIAMHLAARRPERVRALMVFDAQPGAEDPAAQRAWDDLERRARLVGSRSVADAFAGVVCSPSVDRALRDAWVDRLRAAPDEHTRANIRALRERPDAWPLLESIRIPTLLVYGADDVLTPPDIARRMAERMPDARVRIIPGAGHLAPIERPEATSAAVEAFLAEFA